MPCNGTIVEDMKYQVDITDIGTDNVAAVRSIRTAAKMSLGRAARIHDLASGSRRTTLVCGVDKQVAEHLVEQLGDAGVRAEREDEVRRVVERRLLQAGLHALGALREVGATARGLHEEVEMVPGQLAQVRGLEGGSDTSFAARPEAAEPLGRLAGLPVVVGDATRLRALTGWQPSIPFDQMLDDLFAMVR